MNILETNEGHAVEINVHQALQWLVGACLVLLTSLMSWGTLKIVELDQRVSVIESNRFTPADGLQLREDLVSVREYDAALAQIHAQLTRIEDKIDGLQR